MFCYLWSHRHLNHSIFLSLKHPVSLLNILQLIPMCNQRRGVDLSLLDQSEDLGAVAGVHAAGFEGEVLPYISGRGSRWGSS